MQKKKRLMKQLTLGGASLAVGMGLLVSSQLPVQALAPTPNSVTVQYRYLAESELTKAQKDLILPKLEKQSLTAATATENQTLYLVYRADQKKIFGILPATGEGSGALLAISGIAFLVLGVSLVGKKKKGVISSILVITATGSILSLHSIAALQGQVLAAHNQSHQLTVGDKLPEASQIKGYTYLGYVNEKDIADILNSSSSTDTSTSSSTSTSTSTNTSSSTSISSEQEIAYYNLQKLLPFASKEDWLKALKQIPLDHPLATTKIVSLVPMADKTVLSDLAGKEGSANQLLLHLENGSILYLPIQHQENKGDLAYYNLLDLQVGYTPRQNLKNYNAILDQVLPALSAVEFRSDNVYQALGLTDNQEHQMDRLFLEPSFNKIKENLTDYLKKTLVNDDSVNPDDPTSVKDTVQTILNNKEKILLSLAYLDRWYDIQYGDISSKELTLFHTDFFGGKAQALSNLLVVGQNGYTSYSPQRNYAAYGESLATVTGKASLTDFLESYRKLFLPDMSNNDWFKQTTDAYVLETKSLALSEEENQQLNVYDRLSNPQIPEEVITTRVRESYLNMLLPLLTTSEENVYIVSNMSNLIVSMYDRYIDMSLKTSDPQAYQAELDKIKAQIQADAELYRAHYDMWYRVLPENHRHTMLYFQPVWGGYGKYAYDTSAYAWKGIWYSETGKLTQEAQDKLQDAATAETTQAIQEVFGPSGTYFLPELTWAGAYAWRQEVSFVITPLLGTDGAVTLTHEMVHAFDYDKYMLGYNRRAGMQLEAYPEGMLQAPDRVDYSIVGFNSLFDHSAHTGTRYHNLTPDRFQNADDLQQYVRGLFDLIYTLEYAEGTSVLKQTKDVQRQWFHKLETTEKTYPGYEEYGPYGVNIKRDFTDEEWASMELKTIDDLVDYDVTVRRESANRIERDTENPTEVMNNGYHKLSLFAPIWATATTERVPGDLSFRRTAFELLAENGYVNGLVPYMSNQYKQEGSDVVPDSLIFSHILPEYAGDYKNFKKAMYQERVQQFGQLKPVTIQYDGLTITISSYEQLQELMDKAVEADVSAGNFTTEENKVSELKGALHDAYLKLTDDYRTTIFE